MVIILYLLHMDRIIITVVLFVLISVPFIIFQDKLSARISSTVEKADDKKEAKENSMSQNMFILLVLLHTPVVFKNLISSSVLIVYVGIYIAIAMLLLVYDPLQVITMNKINPIFYVIFTFFAYLVLITQQYDWLKLVCVFVLCISFTNIIHEYTDDKKFLYYFILYTVPYIISYIFAFEPSLLTELIRRVKTSQPASYPIQMNNSLLLCVLFFVLLFYSSTFFKHYYGGNQLIRDPISLNLPTEFTIQPSYEYTISYWVYFDSVPPEYSMSTKLHRNIVSCGKEVQTSYESYNHSLYTITQLPTLHIHDTEVLPQQWNHIVLVSHHGQLDIHINGKLVGTTHSISPTEKYMIVGQEQGVKGKICNLFYSTDPFTVDMVQQMYYQLKTHDPPII